MIKAVAKQILRREVPPSAALRISASVRSGAHHLSIAAACAFTSPSGQPPAATIASSFHALHSGLCHGQLLV